MPARKVRGWVTYVIAVGAAVVTMVTLEWLLRGDRAIVVPVAQGAAFLVGWALTWPYAHQTWDAPSLGRYLVGGVIAVGVMIGLRVLLRIG